MVISTLRWQIFDFLFIFFWTPSSLALHNYSTNHRRFNFLSVIKAKQISWHVMFIFPYSATEIMPAFITSSSTVHSLFDDNYSNEPLFKHCWYSQQSYTILKTVKMPSEKCPTREILRKFALMPQISELFFPL